MAEIGVIGAGSWGTALSLVLSNNGHRVTVWSILEDEIEMLCREREHLEKLPGVALPADIIFTTDLACTVWGKDMLVLAVPSPFTRSTARNMAPFVENGQLIVSVAKGIEENTLMIQTQIVEQEIPQAEVAVLSGPSHAEEVGRGLPTTVVVGAQSRAAAEQVQALFMNEVFRVYTSPDMLGIELGGSLKNVIALAAGMADGLGFGDNTKAALITRGIAEIARLALAMGARYETISGLSGIGDLIVTCASMHSRNRRAGMLIGQGYTMEEAMDEVRMVVEGVYSAKAAAALADQYGVDMPIVEQVCRVLFEGQSAKDGVYELMLREKKPESGDQDW
ncbi:MAG: NAD(P)-dependent glycerol-3-phosphate dehydrogenase [Lachnospiraceae bacterium]|nr:NAD(P)-dependent glycerol-3-phosphate dehydrogenase [Lachnospiraceae bacterium]